MDRKWIKQTEFKNMMRPLDTILQKYQQNPFRSPSIITFKGRDRPCSTRFSLGNKRDSAVGHHQHFCPQSRKYLCRRNSEAQYNIRSSRYVLSNTSYGSVQNQPQLSRAMSRLSYSSCPISVFHKKRFVLNLLLEPSYSRALSFSPTSRIRVLLAL